MNELRYVLPPLPARTSRLVWSLLDTHFSPERLQAWAQDLHDHPAGLVHLVAILPPDHGLTAQAVKHAAGAEPGNILAELARQWRGLLPGMHRISLADRAISLTLCVGERSAMLRELQFAADAIYLDEAGPAWDDHALSALARCRRRGTRLAGTGPQADHARKLREMGFVERDGHWVCDPLWNLRQPAHHVQPRTRGRCAVVGAGLAGAGVATQLALRGWQVDVFESGPKAASGASGLPAGLLIPHVSSADGPRSRLTRAGLRLVRQEVERLLVAGDHWAPAGVLELRPEGKSGLPPHWPAEGQELSHPADLESTSGYLPDWARGSRTHAALWHAQAAWVKPAALINAWLDHPRIRLHAQCRVESLRREGDGWQLLGAAGELLAEADDVVLANALDAPRLLASMGLATPAAHGMRGVLSWGLQAGSDTANRWPAHPVNGSGSFIPHVPTPEGAAWFAGSTYENTSEPPAPLHEHLQADLAKLRRLLPAVADDLAPEYESGGSARHWESVRCVSQDRMPWVGAPDATQFAGLWISAAMGSRGLSLALLCAELLSARMGGEPWPVEASLARALDVNRRRRVP